MLKSLAVLTALAVGSVAAAHASSIPITGAFEATGADSYTSSTVTFNTGTGVTPDEVAGTVFGTFSSYLTDGNPITFFPAFPANTPLPYLQGQNTVPGSIIPPGQTGVELLTTSEGGETFDFYMTDYNAQLVSSVTGCTVGNCLDVTGDGYWTASGVAAFTSDPGTFSFTSQYLPEQTAASITSFSASAQAIAPAPEPASLALVGSGLLGFVAFARRRLAA